MIVGVGIDLVEIKRVERAMANHGERFLARIFRPSEIESCRSPLTAPNHFAARFAAKEAAAKAFGTGIGLALRWHDLEIVSQASGQPQLVFHDLARDLAVSRGVTSVFLTLTHEGAMAAAVAILCGAVLDCDKVNQLPYANG